MIPTKVTTVRFSELLNYTFKDTINPDYGKHYFLQYPGIVQKSLGHQSLACTNKAAFPVFHLSFDSIEGDMVKIELQVTSYYLLVESLKVRDEIQKCKFKSTSHEFKSKSFHELQV